MATLKPAPVPKTFRTPAAFRAWLARHHATATELELRLFKVHAAHRGLTYAQALDEALCYGWIDGVVHRLDEDSFRQRYTPRRPRSTWSWRNIGHVERLKKAGRMTPAGLAVYEAREAERSGVYSFEQDRRELTPAYVKAIRANKAAWACFQGQAPGNRRMMAHWIMSAKREETRIRRLGILIDSSARGRKIPQLEALERQAAVGRKTR
jgi:uncharacterized protein YdeI (YjbR/CyaY-like superfamily)